jgi:hypothetical protein
MPAVLVKNVHVSLIRNSRFVGKNSLAAAGERLVFFFHHFSGISFAVTPQCSNTVGFIVVIYGPTEGLCTSCQLCKFSHFLKVFFF